MNHVNAMLEVYKKSCEDSPYPEDRRRYRVVEGLYLKKVPESVQDISGKRRNRGANGLQRRYSGM